MSLYLLGFFVSFILNSVLFVPFIDLLYSMKFQRAEQKTFHGVFQVTETRDWLSIRFLVAGFELTTGQNGMVSQTHLWAVVDRHPCPIHAADEVISVDADRQRQSGSPNAVRESRAP